MRSENDLDKTMGPDSPTQSVQAAEAYNLGNALRKTEKPDAIAWYTLSIQADPKFELPYYNRALTLAEEGRITEARRDLEILRSLGSSRVKTLENLIGVAESVYQARNQL